MMVILKSQKQAWAKWDVIKANLKPKQFSAPVFDMKHADKDAPNLNCKN